MLCPIVEFVQFWNRIGIPIQKFWNGMGQNYGIFRELRDLCLQWVAILARTVGALVRFAGIVLLVPMTALLLCGQYVYGSH